MQVACARVTTTVLLLLLLPRNRNSRRLEAGVLVLVTLVTLGHKSHESQRAPLVATTAAESNHH